MSLKEMIAMYRDKEREEWIERKDMLGPMSIALLVLGCSFQYIY